MKTKTCAYLCGPHLDPCVREKYHRGDCLCSKERTRQSLATSATAAFLVVVILAVSMLAGCPSGKSDAIRKAAEASYRLPAATVDILDKTKAALDAGTIDAATARKVGTILEPVAKAEVVFVGMVRAANAAAERAAVLSKMTNKTPDQAAELASLNASLRTQTAEIKRFFDLEIITPFLGVLEVAKLISGSTAQTVVLAISAARLIIETIGSALKSSKVRELAFVPDIGRPPERSFAYA